MRRESDYWLSWAERFFALGDVEAFTEPFDSVKAEAKKSLTPRRQARYELFHNEAQEPVWLTARETCVACLFLWARAESDERLRRHR